MARFAIILTILTGCIDPRSVVISPTLGDEQNAPALSGGSVATGEMSFAKTVVGNIVLEPRVILGGKLRLLIPEGFTEMEDERIKIKYPNEPRPRLVYTNEPGSVNIVVNHLRNHVSQDELRTVYEQTDANFRRLQPSAVWFQSEIVDINGRDWMMLHLRTPVPDTEIRNLFVGTSAEDRMLYVSVNVTRELEEEWMEAAEAIIQSLQVID